MEIRCGSCNKLFRVSDDKITAKGIKFTCTRCGESVKITREDFENYTLSQTAVTALDMFESKIKSAAAPAAGTEARQTGETAAVPSSSKESGLPETTSVEQKTPDIPAAAPDFLREKENLPSQEPSVFDEQPLRTETHEPEPAPVKEEGLFAPQRVATTDAKQESRPEIEIKKELKPEPEQKPLSKPEPEAVSKQEPAAEPKSEPNPVPKPEPGLQPAQEPKAGLQPRTEPKPAAVPRPEPVRRAAAGAAVSAGAAAPVKKESLRPAPPPPPITVIGAPPAQPARSGMFVILIFVALALAGAGAFFYLRSSSKSANESTPAATSIEGLHVVSAAGSMEPNGDLLISGVVENTTDKEQQAWYIVVDVFDANGTVMNKLKIVNGKQFFTRNDYEIMARRGQNVKEIKAKALAEQGVVIPPKGRVPFEVRYLQPPIGVASFNASLQPFDPIRLYKEMAEEAK